MRTGSPLNVLLITIDCLRPDHMGVYGYGRPTTPNLDGLAHDGIRFTEAISQGPCTRVSFSAMLSSTYPGMFGGFLHLSHERRVLAEFLREAGYRTVAFGSNPYLSPTYGYDKGFEIYDSNLVPWIEARQTRCTKYVNRLFFAGRRFLPYLPANRLTDKAIRFFKRAPLTSPWFLWLHYMDVHDPYRPPRRHARRFARATPPTLSDRALWKKAHAQPSEISEVERQHLMDLYDAEVSFVDEQLGRLFAFLRRRELIDSTLTIVTADHGEEFGEHGEFSHRFKLYDELLRVPLLLRLPARLPAGQVATGQARLLDLVPTVLDVLGLEGGPFEGTSLLPMIEQGDNGGRAAISETQANEGLYAIRKAGWKLILNANTGEAELYHLEQDPSETTNRAAAAPQTRQDMEAELRTHLAHIGVDAAIQTEIEPDRLTTDRLRALGYVD